MPADPIPIPPSVARRVAAWPRMTTAQLRREYATVFGEPTASGNKGWLVRRLAWKVQADATGVSLSPAARARADELAAGCTLRLTPPAERSPEPGTTSTAVTVAPADPRLPPPGTVLTRRYKGRVLRVEVRADGFALDGTVHPSLSAAAKAASGSHCNGFRFFGLTCGGQE